MMGLLLARLGAVLLFAAVFPASAQEAIDEQALKDLLQFQELVDRLAPPVLSAR